jgi:phenylalanyl-tRNA synthetase alpha chain
MRTKPCLCFICVSAHLWYNWSVMSYQNPRISEAAELLKARLNELPNKRDILRAVELRALFDEIKTLPANERAGFGQEVNALRVELTELANQSEAAAEQLPPIDVTAPFDVNTPADKMPRLMSRDRGSKHPLTAELETILDIFYRMGFTAVESREIDDDFHMFGALNFPEGHPARDDYDTFMTTQTDQGGKALIAPAHTSTMQHRVLQEGVYVGKGVNAGNLIATLKTFLQAYYGKELEVKTQPFYFPFTEPSFEFALSCPFCDKQGCNICSYSGWIELLGCGMIHPNVLHTAGIDTNVYTGFAWGGGIERLVMMKYGIEDIRHFESGRLDFLRQFS